MRIVSSGYHGRKAGFDLDYIRAFSSGALKASKKGHLRRGTRDELIRESPFNTGVYLHGHRIGGYNSKTHKLSVSSAGWHTNTTKTRLNKILYPTGNQVVQRNYNWFLEVGNGRKRVPFKDNMSFKL